MASDRLFEMLANAKAQPDRWARALNAGTNSVNDIMGGYIKGKEFKSQQREAELKPYEIWSKISDSAGPDVANSIFKKTGFPVPDMETPSITRTPEELARMPGTFAKTQLGNLNTLDEMKKRNQDMALTGPEDPKSFKASVLASGQMTPEAFDSWAQANIDPATGLLPRKNADQLKSNLGLKAQAANAGARNEFYGVRSGTMQLGQLPSQMPAGTVPGAAAGVKLAARQGKSLIAKATTPQNLKLASIDLTRAVARMAPDAATIGESNYASSLPTLVGRFTQIVNSDPASPDVPKLRKEIYKTLDELDKSATPFLMNHLANMEANGSNSTFGNNWQATKDRELGNNIPDIPFDEGAGQNPNVSTGVPQYRYAKNAQGQRIRSADNWATSEPVAQGQ